MNESSPTLGFVAPEPSDLKPLFPAYEIHHLVATGGMGAVYQAVQKSLDRTVALKILPMEFSDDAEFCAGFEAEAKAMARLNHPNLIGVYDFGEVNGMLYIIMEFVPGKSIYHSAYGLAIDQEEVIRLVTGVCNGLAHAHENGILHRDIKPSNILLTPQKEPKIGDFGLARPVEWKSQEGEVVYGTPGYTAPEVVDTPALVDHRADLFSVGVFLHELLTGKLPADDARPASVIAGCDPRFDAIIRRATDPVPANRYSGAAEIASELQKITTAPKIAAPAKAAAGPPAGPARPGPPRRTVTVVKSKSMNLKWVGPLIAISIMGFCWYQFMNMKPRVVEIGDSVAKSSSTVSSEGEVDPFASSAATQTAPPSLPPPSRPPLQPPVQPELPPSAAKVQDIGKPEADIRQSVFLDDLNETEVKIEYGRLGKHGSGPEKSGARALVNGIKPEHSLCPHPHQYGTSLVSYTLDGKYSTFSGTATVADNASPRSLRFCIKGDGKTLWRSEIIQSGKHAEEFSVSVKGINKLELEIACPASSAGAWGMWVSPQLLLTSPPEQASGTANFKSPENAGLKNNLIDTSIERSSSTSRETNSAIPSDAKLFNGKKYFVFEKKSNWTEASRRCESMGGQLVVIADVATQKFIEDLAAHRVLWLGATDKDIEGKWRWVDGTEMKFKNFGRGQPDNWQGLEHWLSINWKANNGEWNDVGNDRMFGYICEWSDKAVGLAATKAPVVASEVNPKVDAAIPPLPTSVIKQIVSDFETDSDGWRGINTSNGPENLSHESGGATPVSGGHVAVIEQKGDGKGSFFAAPTKFLGDQTSAYRGSLRFYLKQSATTKTAGSYPLVVLKSAGQELHYQINQVPPSTVWTLYDIPISENSGWTDKQTGGNVSKDKMLEVLGSIQSLWVLAEYSTNNYDRADLDDFSLFHGEVKGQAGQTADIVGTWKYSPTVVMEIKPDGRIFSNSKPTGTWTRRDKITEYFIVLTDGSSHIGTLDKYKRVLSIASRSRGVGGSMERIDNGPTKNFDVPNQAMAWRMEYNDLKEDLTSMKVRLEATRKSAADYWQKHSEARAMGRLSIWNVQAQQAESTAKDIEMKIKENQGRIEMIQSKLGGN